jgi:hypothetical protein
MAALSGMINQAALSEMIDQLFQEDPQRLHEKAIEYTISRPKIANMDPVSIRSPVKISEGIIHIGTEGKKDDTEDDPDPHTFMLLAHPENPKRWRLWSICPRGHNSVSYRIKAKDEQTAIRRANVSMDIATGKIEVTKEMLEDDSDEG